MLFACGREEREHARLGSAMSCSGAMPELEDERDEPDFVDMTQVWYARATRSVNVGGCIRHGGRYAAGWRLAVECGEGNGRLAGEYIYWRA